MDEDLLLTGDEQAPASETTTTEIKQQEAKPKRDHWSFRVNFSDPAPLVPGFNSNRSVGLDPFTPWVGKDPVVVGQEPSANANAYVPIDPLQSFSAGQTQAINVLGRPFTRDQLYSMPGGRTLMRFTDKLNRGTSRGFMDAVTEVTPWTFIPFFNTVGEIGGSLYNAKRAGETFEKLQRGDAISNEEAVLAQAYMAESTWRAHNTTMGTVGDIAITMPALCVGYGASAKVVQAAVNKTIKSLPARYTRGLAVDAATKMSVRQTTDALQNAIRTMASKNVDKAAMDAARQTIAAYHPGLSQALSLTEKAASKEAAGSVTDALKRYVQDGILTTSGKAAIKRAAFRQAIRDVTERATEEATSSRVSASIAKKIYLNKFTDAAAEFTKLAEETQNTAIKNIYAKAAKDILEKSAEGVVDTPGMQKIAGDALTEVSKYTTRNTVLKTGVLDYVKNYVGKATAIRADQKFSQWWLSTANLYKDAAIRGLTEHGASIIDTLPMSWQGHMAQALATMTVDAPIKGLAYTLLGRAVRMPITALWTAISPTEDGFMISPVTQQELAIKYAALESDDDEMMNNAWWMALGSEWVENASESTGEAFSHLGKGLLGLSKGGQSVAMRLAKQAAPNLVDNAVNRMRAVGTAMHDRIKSMCGDSVSNAVQVEKLKQQAIRRLMRNPVMMERTFGKDAANMTFNKVWGDNKLRAAALKSARKLMSHKALLATAINDKLIRLGDVVHSNLLSPSGVSNLFKKIQWDGVIGEMLEERYGDFANALFGNDAQVYLDKEDDGVFGRRSLQRAFTDALSAMWPDWDQFKAELIAFAIPGTANSLALRAQTALGTGSLSRFNRLMEERQYFYNKAQAVLEGGGEEAYKAAVERFQREVSGPEAVKTSGDQELDFDALSAAGRFAVGDGAAGVTLQETNTERPQGANTQAPASQEEIDEWIGDFVSAAKDYAKIINDISFNTNMSMTAKVLHKVIGAINFGLTGNYAMLRYDPMIAMTQMCINGDRLLLSAAGAAKASLNRAVEDVMKTAPDELRKRLTDKNIITANTGNKKPDINQTALLREIGAYNADIKNDIEKLYDRYAKEEITKIAKASFAMEGTLRVSMSGDISVAAERLADARLQPYMERIRKGETVSVSYIGPMGDKVTKGRVNADTLEDVRKEMVEADKVNLAFRYFSIAHDGSIKYKQAENHGLNRAAQIILTVNNGKYSDNQEVAVYQHQLDGAIAMMAMNRGQGRVSVAANVDTIDVSVMDEMKKFGMPLDMSDVAMAATLNSDTFTLTDQPIEEQVEASPALQSLVKMMTAMGALHMDNADAIRGIYREGIRLAKILNEHMNVRNKPFERTFILRDGGKTRGIEVSVKPNTPDGKIQRAVTYYDRETKKTRTVNFIAEENTNGDTKYTEFYLDNVDGTSGHETLTSFLESKGYRLTNRTVLFTPASRIAITDPLVGVFQFANLRSKFLNNEEIKNGKFGRLFLGTDTKIGYFNLLESMDMIRAAREIARQYDIDDSKGNVKETYQSAVRETDENNNPTGKPKITADKTMAMDLRDAMAVADRVADKIVRDAAVWSGEFGKDENGAYLISVGAASDAENVVVPFDPAFFSSPSAAVVNEIISNRIMSRLDAKGGGTALSEDNIKLFHLDKIMSSLLATAKNISNQLENDIKNNRGVNAELRTEKASIDELIATTLSGGLPTRETVSQFITNLMFGYGNWARKNGNYISNQAAWGRITEDWIKENPGLFTLGQIYTAWLFGGQLSANGFITPEMATSAMEAYDEALGVYGVEGTREWLAGLEIPEEAPGSIAVTEEGEVGGDGEADEDEAGEPVPGGPGAEPVAPVMPKRMVKVTVTRGGSAGAVGASMANIIRTMESAGVKMTLESLLAEMDNCHRANVKGGNVQEEEGSGQGQEDGGNDGLPDGVKPEPVKLNIPQSSVNAATLSNFKDLPVASAVAITKLLLDKAVISVDIIKEGDRKVNYSSLADALNDPAAHEAVYAELCKASNGYIGTAFEYRDMALIKALSDVMSLNAKAVIDTNELREKIKNERIALEAATDNRNKGRIRAKINALQIKLRKLRAISGYEVGRVVLPEGAKYTTEEAARAAYRALTFDSGSNTAEYVEEDVDVEEADQVTDSGNDSFQSDTIYQLNKSDQWQAVKFVMGALFPETNGNVAAACMRIVSEDASLANAAKSNEGQYKRSTLAEIISGGSLAASKYLWHVGETAAPEAISVGDAPAARLLGGLLRSFTRQQYNKAIQTMSSIVQLSGVEFDRDRKGNITVRSDDGMATQPHMALRMRVASELLDWIKDKKAEDIDKAVRDSRTVGEALSAMSRTLGDAVKRVSNKLLSSPGASSLYGLLMVPNEGVNAEGKTVNNEQKKYAENEVIAALTEVKRAGYKNLSTAGLLVTAMGRSDVVQVTEASEVAGIGAIGILLSEYASTFRLGRKTVGGKTTELNKGSIAIAQRGLVDRLVEMLDKERWTPGERRDTRVAYGKRFCVLGDKGIPIFTHVTTDKTRAVDIIPAMLRAIFNGNHRPSDDMLVHFPTYTGDRSTLTTVQLTFRQMMDLAGKIAASEKDNKVAGIKHLLSDESFDADGQYNAVEDTPGHAMLTSDFILENYLGVARWINKQCKLDQIEPKRTQVVSSEQVPIPLARIVNGVKKAPKVAVYLSKNSGSNETWFGTGYFFSPNKERDGALHAFEPDDANTSKVHIVSVNNGTGRLEMIKGDFVLNVEGVKYASSAMRKISEFGNNLAKNNDCNVVMTDFDGIKVGPLAFDSSKVPGIEILDQDGNVLSGKLGDILKAKLLAANGDVKAQTEILEGIKVSEGGSSEGVVQSYVISVRIDGKQYSMRDLMPNITVEPFGENDLVLTYDAENMEALMAANLYHESSLTQDKMTANNATDVMTGLQRIVSKANPSVTPDLRGLATKYLKVLSDYSELAGYAFTKQEMERIIMSDPDLYARYNLCSQAPDVKRDVALTLGSALIKCLTPKVFRTKAVLMSSYAKSLSTNPADVDNSLRDKTDAFYTKNEDKNGVGYIRANIDSKYVRYGCFLDATDDEIKEAIAALNAAMGRGGANEASATYTVRDLADSLARADKDSQFNDNVKAAKLKALSLFRSAYDGTQLGEESLYSLWSDLSTARDEEFIRVGGADKEQANGNKIKITYANGNDITNENAIYIPGTLVTFPRSPSYNLGPVFTSLRLSTAVSYGTDGKPSRDSLAIAAPSAMRRLGADHDGDTAFLMLPFSTMSAPLADGKKVTYQVGGRSIATTKAYDLTDTGKDEIRRILAGELTPDKATDKVVSSLVQADNDTGRYVLSKDYINDVGASMIAAFNMLSVNRDLWLTESEWDVGAVGVKNFEGENKAGLASMFGKEQRDMLNPYHVVAIMDSARGASVARGAAVAQIAALHKAIEFGFVPFIGPVAYGSYNNTYVAQQDLTAKAEKLIRVLDGYANALFDDLKEQLSFRMRLTPETMDAVVGELALWALNPGTKADDITPENAAEHLSETYLDLVDGKERMPFSGALGLNMLFALHSDWTAEDANRELRRLGANVDPKAVEAAYGAKDVKFDQVLEYVSTTLGLYDKEKDSYNVDRGAIAALSRSPLIKSIVYSKNVKGDSLIHGAYFMAMVNKFSAAVNPYKASVRSERSRTAAAANFVVSTTEESSTEGPVAATVYETHETSNGPTQFAIGIMDPSAQGRFKAVNSAVSSIVKIPGASDVAGDATVNRLQALSDTVTVDGFIQEAEATDAGPTEEAGVPVTSSEADGGDLEPYDGETEEAGAEVAPQSEGTGTGTLAPKPQETKPRAFRFGKRDLETVWQAQWATVAAAAYQKTMGSGSAMISLNDKFIELGDIGGQERTNTEKWLIGVELTFSTLYKNMKAARANLNAFESAVAASTEAIPEETKKYIEEAKRNIWLVQTIFSMFNRPNFGGKGYMRIHPSAPDGRPVNLETVSQCIQEILNNGDSPRGVVYTNGNNRTVRVKDKSRSGSIALMTGMAVTMSDIMNSANELQSLYDTPTETGKKGKKGTRKTSYDKATISVRDFLAAMIQYSALTSRTRIRSDVGSGSFINLLSKDAKTELGLTNENVWSLAAGWGEEADRLASLDSKIQVSEYAREMDEASRSVPQDYALAALSDKSTLLAILGKQILRRGRNGGTSSFVNLYVPHTAKGPSARNKKPTVKPKSPTGYDIGALIATISTSSEADTYDLVSRLRESGLTVPNPTVPVFTGSRTVVARTIAVTVKNGEADTRVIPVVAFTYMKDLESNATETEFFVLTEYDEDAGRAKSVRTKSIDDVVSIANGAVGQVVTEEVEIDLNGNEPTDAAVKAALDTYKETEEGKTQVGLSRAEQRAYNAEFKTWEQEYRAWQNRSATPQRGSAEDAKRKSQAAKEAKALADKKDAVDKERKTLGKRLMEAMKSNLSAADGIIDKAIGDRLKGDKFDAYSGALTSQTKNLREDRDTADKAGKAKDAAKKEIVNLLSSMLGASNLDDMGISEDELNTFIDNMFTTRMKVNLSRAVSSGFLPGDQSDKRGDMFRKTFASYHDIVSGTLQMMAGNGFLLFNDINNKASRLRDLLTDIIELSDKENKKDQTELVKTKALAAYLLVAFNTYLQGDRYNLSTSEQFGDGKEDQLTSVNAMLFLNQLNPSDEHIVGIARTGTYKMQNGEIVKDEEDKPVKAEDRAIGMRHRALLESFVTKWLTRNMPEGIDSATYDSLAKELTNAVYARAKAAEGEKETARKSYDDLLTHNKQFAEAIDLFGEILYRTQSVLSAAHFTSLQVRDAATFDKDAKANANPLKGTAVADIVAMHDELVKQYASSPEQQALNIPEGKMLSPTASKVLGPVYNEFLNTSPVDEISDSVLMLDPTMAFKHYSLPTYGGYNLRDSVKFGSGQEVIAEGMEVSRHFEMMYGLSDVAGRICPVRVVDDAEEVVFEKGAFVVKGKNGKRIVFDSPERAMLPGKWAFNAQNMMLTEDEKDMARLISRARMSEVIGGTDKLYTGIGNASGGAAIGVNHTDFGTKNKGIAGVDLYTKEQFFKHWSKASVLERHQLALRGDAQVSALFYWMQGVYSRIPDVILDEFKLEQVILDELWNAGQIVFGPGAKTWSPGNKGQPANDRVASQQLTDVFLSNMIKRGLVAVSDRKDNQGRRITSLTLPVKGVETCFKRSSLYRKLLDAGRTEEMLSAKYAKEAVAPVLKKLSNFIHANPDVAMGDTAGFTGFGENFWLCGNGLLSSSSAVKAQWSGKRTAILTEEEEAAAASFATTLHYKRLVPLFEQSGDLFVLNGERVGRGLIEMFNDVVANKMQSDGKTYSEIPFMGDKKYTPDEIRAMGLSVDTKVGDIAALIYRATVEQKYEGTLRDSSFRDWSKNGLGVSTFDSFIRAYENSDIGMSTSVAAPTYGMTMDSAFKLQASLPTDAGLGAMINRLCMAVADCCAYTGTLHSLATTVSYEGLPNYIIVPNETKEYGEIFDDRMYGELAMWYDRVFKLGLKYDGVKNGRTNLREAARKIVEKLGKRTFDSKYTALADDPKIPGSGSFTGVEKVYCFIPNSEDAHGRVKMDDSHSKLTMLGARDSEAYGYMKKLCWIKAGVYNNHSSVIRALDNIHSFSKASNVWGSLFFTIATKFESPIAASGLLNTLLGQFESGSDWMHSLKPGKETDIMSNFGSVVDSMIFGGSKPSEWGIGGGMLTYRDIIKMMDSNDPALIQLRKLCADVGVTMSYPNDSTVLDENSKNFSRAIDKMSEQFAKWVSIANPEMKGRAKDYATGFFRGLATDQRERAFTYVMNATKMAVVAQICAKMRNIAVMNGMYFDPVVELRKVGNYINEEVGGIDPLAHAFDTPAMRRIMNRLLFSWQWTMGSWSAGGGTVLTNALLGGDATTPMMRGNIIGRWLRMYGWVQFGVPFFAQNIINAFSKGIFLLCGDDPNRYEWLFLNNEEKNQNAFDITPLLTAMTALDKKFLGSTLYNAKTGAYGSVFKGVASLIPMYTGTGDNVTGRRHKYMHFAKQGEEVGRWFTDPGGQLWAKFSSPVRWALESTFGYNYAGYEVSWRAARETPLQSMLSPNGAVFKGALSCLLPFSVSSMMNGSGESGVLTAVGPVTNSISKYSGSKKLERELREYIKTAGLTRGKPLFRRHKAKIEQTLKDLELNGYPVEAILAGARGKVAGDLYNQLFAALPPTVNSYYDAKRVNDIARQLRALGVKPGGPIASIKGKYAMRSRNVTRDPAYQRAKGIVEGLFDSDLSAYYGRDVRQAMKGGYSQVFGDNVPRSIFGAPVSVGDGGYFEKNPASGGYFTPGNKKLPESVFGVPVMTGDNTGIDKRPYMRLPSNLPKSVFGAPVVARNRSWGDRRRAEGSFYDTRKFLAQDDTPNKIFGVPVNWQDHPLFAERPSIPGFYETGSEAQRAMKRRDVKSVFGIPVSWDGDDDDDPDDPPPGGGGLPSQAADEGGNVSDSPYVDDYEYGVNLALGHADDTYAYAGYTDKEIDDLVSRENKNANVAIGKDDEVFRTPTSALAGREDEFIEWARRNMTEPERREGYGRDYDYVGAFLAGEGRDKYGNGYLTDDFKLPNHPSFNPEAIMDRFRRAGREDDGIEYIRNALSRARGVNPKQWVARSQSPKDLVTFKGFEDERYKENDYAIRRAVYLINKNPEKYIGLTKGQLAEWRERYPNGIPADLLKSVMITETGGRDKRSREAFAVDPFQVNVAGDWGDAKASLGLRKTKANNTGDKLTNVMAAIIFLLRKGYGKSGIAPKDAPRDEGEATYDGIDEAIRRYHGTTQDGVDRYVNKTMNRYLFPHDEIIQPGKGAKGDAGTY